MLRYQNSKAFIHLHHQNHHNHRLVPIEEIVWINMFGMLALATVLDKSNLYDVNAEVIKLFQKFTSLENA